ncbi:hypothetical protein O6P43_034329 [Quillaja saponaria]|uniref:Uncharacterized protein n=1 Tax=Quillaja saponaria TaxID=32244 RepID=A0AAD7P7V1_QUISA|nr:hypothetical protein O6P43_034329 [Quillaja saponaria]
MGTVPLPPMALLRHPHAKARPGGHTRGICSRRLRMACPVIAATAAAAVRATAITKNAGRGRNKRCGCAYVGDHVNNGSGKEDT